MAIGASAIQDKIKQPTNAFGSEERDRHKRQTKQDRPPIDPLDRIGPERNIWRLTTGKPCGQQRYECGTDDGTIESTAPTDGDPNVDCAPGDTSIISWNSFQMMKRSFIVTGNW